MTLHLRPVPAEPKQPKRAASARGLFRATGKTSKPVATRNLLGEIVTADALEREAQDFYATPPEPTRAFLAAELERLCQFPTIWEPACGDGAMVREMQALGLKTTASDMIDRGMGAEIRSFYDFAPAHLSKPTAIVTNPPFAECGWGNGKARWLYHALATLKVDYMALLLNWTWPGAGGLAPFWADYPASRVYLMRWKIDFTGQGAPPMLNGWFVWDRHHQGETILRMLDRADARQGNLFSSIPEPAETVATVATGDVTERNDDDKSSSLRAYRDVPVEAGETRSAPEPSPQPSGTPAMAAGGPKALCDDDLEIPAFLLRKSEAA